MTWAEVSQARIDGLEAIPTLAELMEEFPEAYFNIDAKSDATVDALIAHLRRTASLQRTCVGAFSHRRLVKIRSILGDQVCTSASPREVAQWILGRVPSGPSCLQVPIRHKRVSIITQRSLRLAEMVQCPVHVWTVDDPYTMQKLLDLGVHGIMTDRADILRDIVRLNAIWPE
jgi:glycerophosphoryl diester phosphodiesterase